MKVVNVLFVIILLVGIVLLCVNIHETRQYHASLEESLQAETIASQETVETEETNNSTLPLAETEETSERLIESVIGSNRPSDWLAIARSNEATTEELEEVARLNAKLSLDKKRAIEIAIALIKNPKCNQEIVKTLGTSYYYSVRAVAASSPHAKEEELMYFATLCAKNTSHRAGAREVARVISSNCNCTDKVIRELSNAYYYCVLEEAAKSYYSEETSLMEIARKCSAIRNSEEDAVAIAKAIANNVNVTKSILQELKESSYEAVRKLAGEKIVELDD